MLSETIIQLVDQYGYLIFFLAFCLGPFGIPVPNEITILTGGVLANEGVMNPWIIYICILTGLLTAVTIGYILGKMFSQRILLRLKGKKSNRHFIKAEKLFNKYGNLAICIGFFIPIVRYLVPVAAGISGVKYKVFALLSYSTAIIWTSAFFGLGMTLGDRFSQIQFFY
ncbi:DedA family protein [Cytobacillus dafuensis]|uniref:DedA family protein n=1 Tax=Cytobacillus dafuensis TaxID=1742359 RepID=A0A5B8Z860_CYTDA|nr:DedA family protein [Cytobacillus dafuensis]QED49275.1 DedA family protein [Cytobacillus dafuensis]